MKTFQTLIRYSAAQTDAASATKALETIKTGFAKTLQGIHTEIGFIKLTTISEITLAGYPSAMLTLGVAISILAIQF